MRTQRSGVGPWPILRKRLCLSTRTLHFFWDIFLVGLALAGDPDHVRCEHERERGGVHRDDDRDRGDVLGFLFLGFHSSSSIVCGAAGFARFG